MESSLFELRDGRVYLTADGMIAMPKAIITELAKVGVKVSRASVHRAKTKNAGIIVPGYHDRHQGLRRRLKYGYVVLSVEEMAMSVKHLMDLFGIHVTTAERAKARGWFEVQKPRYLSNSAEARVQGIGEYMPGDMIVPS